MGMRFTNPEQERFATVVGGRPGGKGGFAVDVSPALRGFLTRLFDDAEARRAFLADPAAAVAADGALGADDRTLLLAIPPEKVRAIELMIPAAAAPRRASVMAAGVTALAVFLGLAGPAPSRAEDAFASAPGGIRPDLELEQPVIGGDQGGESRLKITKGIRPDFNPEDMQVSRGIRPDADEGGLLDPNQIEEIFGGKPALPEGTSEVVVGTGETGLGNPPGTGEVGVKKTGETKVGKPAKPFHIDRPNVTRGIRPKID